MREKTAIKSAGSYRKAWRRGILALMLCPLLVSCGEFAAVKLVSTGVGLTMNDVFRRTDVNLKEKNYAAADYMASQMQDFVRKQSDLIVFWPLTETDNGQITSPLGMNIPEEIGLRLAQLGYKVSVAEVASMANKGFYAPSKDEADFVFGGHYLRVRKAVNVHLRITNAKTGQVVASFDYSMPITSQIRRMSETPTQIFRVEPDY